MTVNFNVEFESFDGVTGVFVVVVVVVEMRVSGVEVAVGNGGGTLLIEGDGSSFVVELDSDA